MTNLEFLKCLDEYKIVSVEPDFKSKYIHIWDSDRWKEIIVQFDEEGNIVKI